MLNDSYVYRNRTDKSGDAKTSDPDWKVNITADTGRDHLDGTHRELLCLETFCLFEFIAGSKNTLSVRHYTADGKQIARGTSFRLCGICNK
jgi:hypothetical protein